MITDDLLKLIENSASGSIKFKQPLYCFIGKYATYTDNEHNTYNTDYLCSKITNIRKYSDGTINVAYYNLNKAYTGYVIDDDACEWRYITISPIQLSLYNVSDNWKNFSKENE